MIRSVSYLLALAVFAITVESASAQVQTGTPQFGTFDGGPDVLDLANLNAHFTIPVRHKTGRAGMDFIFDLTYDSSVWAPVQSGATKVWIPPTSGAAPNVWGWQGLIPAGQSYVTYSMATTSSHCGPSGGSTYIQTVYSNLTYQDSSGTAHHYGGTIAYIQSPGGASCPPNGPQPATTTGISDNTGYTLYPTPLPSNINAYVTNTTGTIISPPVLSNPPAQQTPITTTDRNGNIVSSASGVYTDTLGQNALNVVYSASSNTTLSYVAPSGATAPYVVSYRTYTVKTNFGCSGVAEYGPTSNLFVDKITLPDGTFYQFSYEATPGGPAGDITGRLGSVTLPTGGVISYVYTGGSSGHITCADGSSSGFTRQTPDGSWTYARTLGTGSIWTTTVTDPQNNQSTHDFSGLYELQWKVFQGSTTSGTVLQNGVNCYNGNFTNCISTTLTPPITSKWAYRYFPSLANPAITATFYNSFGLLTEDREFDYVPTSTGVFLTDTGIVYAALGNGIVGLPQTITVIDDAGNTLSKVTNTYDQGTPTATSGTPQHIAITGSRGNLTTTASTVQGTTTLNQTFTYYDTGNVQTATDVNGAATTYSYAGTSCGNAFPTSVSEPLSLSRSFAWNCTGGVQTSVTDENSQVTSTVYSDPDFWRPHSTTDATGAITTITYNGQNSVESVLLFNSNASATDVLTTLDGLGRVHLQQTRQAPGSGNFDTVETDYDSLGRPSRVTLPYVGTAGQTNAAAPAVTTTYDAQSRPLQVSDAGAGSTTYSYPQNDVLVTVGPAPIGENTKRRQLQYDGLGRITSACEITGLTGGGTCSQNSAPPGSGYWTTYAYGPGNLLTVKQNAQAAVGSQQTRTYAYDGLGRLTSETNPESGTTTYVYDVIPSGCFAAGTSSPGDMTKKSDAAGNIVCPEYDALHRVWSVGSNTGCKRFGYDNGNVIGSRPSGVTVTNGLGRLVEAETDNCGAWPPTPITDEWFSYSNRGDVTNFWESTPHSGAYYNMAGTYWANGVLSSLNTPTYSMNWFLDGEGRVSGADLPLTSTIYNAASQPTQINFSSGDSDQFTYDPNTGRMTQYKFNINGQSDLGNLTWNANGTLGSLVITDPFNAANAQTCNYSHDDLVRIASVNCGATKWQQNFTYDAFGNITKTVPVGGTGNSFQPTYSTATNHITNIAGFTPTYDAAGDVINDSNHTYAWDGYLNPTTIDGVGITYDALDRMVEQNRGGSFTEITYSPTGFKMQLMNGITAKTDYVPLPGGAMLVYSASAPSGGYWIRHPDWLGSSRLASNPNRTILYDGAYAPFGEPYAQSGTTDLSYTQMNQDTSTGLYDFPAREYSTQGRWSQPDPAGFAAADPSSPQSWNRYAYVLDGPLGSVDPLGLCGGGPGGVTVSINGSVAGSGLFTSPPCPGGSGGDSGGSGGLGSGHDTPSLDAPPVNLPGGGGNSSGSNIKWLQTKVFFQALGRNFVDEFKPGGCVAAFAEGADKADFLGAIPPGQPFIEDAIKGTAATVAANYAATQALTVPLRSSVVRGILATGETAAAYVAPVYLLGLTVSGAIAEGKAIVNGTCH
jgi:RHS repeat-associated protein